MLGQSQCPAGPPIPPARFTPHQRDELTAQALRLDFGQPTAAGYRCRIDSKTAEERIQHRETRAAAPQADQQGGIPARPVSRFESAAAAKGIGADECALLHLHVRAGRHGAWPERVGPDPAHDLPCFVDDEAVAGNNVDVRMFVEVTFHLRKSARQKAIIGVKVTENVPPRPREAPVQPIGRAIVRFEQAQIYSIAEFIHDRTAAIVRTRIADDVFQVGASIALDQY